MSAWKTKATSTGEGGDYPKAPPGNHPAVLVALIDMGMQEDEYQGVRKVQHRAYLCWELVQETIAGTKGSNHVIGIDMTVSLNEKARLRKWIETWFNKKIPEGVEFDIDKLLGKKCLLTVVLNKKGYPQIEGVAAPPKGMTIPDPQHKPFLWDLTDIKADGSIDLPDWIPWLFGEPLKDHIHRRVTEDAIAPPRENNDSDPNEESHEEAESEGIPF